MPAQLSFFDVKAKSSKKAQMASTETWLKDMRDNLYVALRAILNILKIAFKKFKDKRINISTQHK